MRFIWKCTWLMKYTCFFGKNMYTCMFQFFLEMHEKIHLFWLEFFALSRAYSKFDNLLLALYHTFSWHFMSSCCVFFLFFWNAIKAFLQKSLKGNLHNRRKSLKIQLPIHKYMTRPLMSRHTTTRKNI